MATMALTNYSLFSFSILISFLATLYKALSGQSPNQSMTHLLKIAGEEAVLFLNSEL